jgi:uncharacterized membrane protein
MNKNNNQKIYFERISIKATRWIGSIGSLIIHTLFFVGCFILYFYEIPIDKILLVLTTVVSLEAIYLAIFIQMSVNRQARKLKAVARDVDEIQEDVEEIQKDVEGIEKDVDEIQEDVEDIQEDVEDIQEEEAIEEKEEKEDDDTLTRIENTLEKLIEEIIELKKQHQDIRNKK